MTKKKPGKESAAKADLKESGRACGLCGKRKKLRKTECCDRWICDDESSYVLFSYARNSCDRNHRRFTLCGFHFNEKHEGNWKDCKDCREAFETEMYVYYGTSEYNFEVLEKPPAFKPTKCSKCKTRIILGNGGYSQQGSSYLCMECSGLKEYM